MATLSILALALAATPALAAPLTATIDPPTEVSYTTAHVSGHVTPGDDDVEYFFQIGGNTLPPQSLAANSGETTVSADLSELIPGQEYIVYLVAFNSDFSEYSAPQITFTTKPVASPTASTVSIDAPSSITPTSAHFSGQIKPEAPAGNPAAFDVNWHFACTPECPGLVGGTVAADSTGASHEVSADTSGLKRGTDYEVSLVAENAGGQVTVGPKSFSTPAILPQLGALKVDPLSTEAELTSTINPGGATTTYHFEYGATESYGQSTATRTMPAGEAPVPVSANLFGLSPASGYHYRLIASNSVGTVESPDQTFTTKPTDAEIPACPNDVIRIKQGSQRLPDCRAFERVSPAENAGVPVYPGYGLNFSFRATADGDKALYMTYRGTYPGAGSTPWEPRVRAMRTNDGWFSESIDKPTSSSVIGISAIVRPVVAVSKDMTRMVVASSLSLGGQGIDGNGNLYIYDANTGEYTLVMTSPNPEFLIGFVGANFVSTPWIGGSGDFRTIAFESLGQVYAWSESTGLRSLGAGKGIIAGAYTRLRPGGISEDGSRIYYREDAGAVALDENGQKTVVSVSRRAGDPPDPVPAYPEAASPDGRYLIFSSPHSLTEDAPASPTGKPYGLYRYDAETDDIEYLAHLSGAVGAVNPEGVLRAWPERKEAYLRVAGNPGDDLYHLHDGELSLVAANYVSAANSPAMSASPNGRYVIFTNAGTGALELYDAETEVLSSIGKGNLGPAEPQFEAHSSQAVTDDGTAFFSSSAPLVATDVNGTSDVYSYRDGRFSLISPGNQPFDAAFAEVTPSGRDVFFTTEQHLVATDIDEAIDLYDARVEGGIAAQNVTPIPPCAGDACRGAIPQAPEGLNAATETLYGRENPHPGASKRCGKGQQRQKHKGKSRCVKQHKRNAKQNKQNRNRSQGR